MSEDVLQGTYRSARDCFETKAELCELLAAVTLFIENYRRMHAGTRYAPRVEAAARRVRAKLLEV